MINNENNSSELFQSDLDFAIETIRDTCKAHDACIECPMNINCNEHPAIWKKTGGEQS